MRFGHIDICGGKGVGKEKMSSTIAALSTPNGESAIAVIRLSGDLCPEIAEQVFGKKVKKTPRTAHFGKYKLMGGDEADDVIYTYFKAPHSYTGEDMLEISVHGNPFIVQLILQDLMRRGCAAAAAGEFTRRAFENDKFDLSQAEAVALTIGARCARSLKAARRQLSGELGKRINSMSQKLADLRAAGKTKTTQFRELMGEKLANGHTIALLHANRLL